MTATVQRLVFPAANEVVLEQLASRPVSAGEVRIRTQFSLMSTGTENIVFNGRFEPDSHWAQYGVFPFQPGYACVGEVVEAGPEVRSPRLGETVYLGLPHASEHVVGAEECVLVPQGVDPRQATWCALAGVAFVAVRKAEVPLGGTVLIVGAGPVGQMCLRWARAAGARRVLVVDPVPGRTEIAAAGGATSVVVAGAGDSRDAVRGILGGLPPIVIEATGHHRVFAESLPLVNDHGRLVLVGDTGAPSMQHLTADVVPRGLTIVGAHGGHLGHVLGLDATSGDEQLDVFHSGSRSGASRALGQIFFEMVADGRFPLDGLISHEFPIEKAAAAYALANDARSETMGILFTWGKPLPGTA
jgi:2-desacetyl-2-hydroxyethyl bacteriochlorophyllide A dehydrogenase